MRRATAAAYCDMTIADFERAIIDGALPGPVTIGDAERWSRIEIDEMLSRLTGDHVPDWRSGAKLYAQADAS
ncbi:MAG: hypothetical protein KF780_12305 [Sphingomonas sp.]|nr:hypothetical protein [Sphingomonas sp.]